MGRDWKDLWGGGGDKGGQAQLSVRHGYANAQLRLAEGTIFKGGGRPGSFRERDENGWDS